VLGSGFELDGQAQQGRAASRCLPRRSGGRGRGCPGVTNPSVTTQAVLRPLRMLRLVTLLSSLNRRAASSLRGRVAVYVCGATVLVVFCAALAEVNAERRNPDANITTFRDAAWWAISTITTVGYGDRYPTTTEGRLVAALLMLGGIALLGVVTASLASWLLDKVRQVEAESQAATRADIHELSLQITTLQQEITALRSVQDEAKQ
jgi:voltage-gated potassium channel